MMIRMMTVTIAIIVASSAFPMLPLATIEMYLRKKEKCDDRNEMVRVMIGTTGMMVG